MSSTPSIAASPAEMRNQPPKSIYKLTFFVPPTHTQPCLTALFAAGAGIWPNSPLPSGSPDTSEPKYTKCAFITTGTGQFLPSSHATPNIGTPGELEYVKEDRVEVVVWDTEEVVREAVAEMRRVHPYEVVAVFVVKCEEF